MKRYLLILLAGLLMAACGDDDKVSNGNILTPGQNGVQGKVEKGPFISGSTITLHPMDARLALTGKSFTATITDHTGNFAFEATTLDAPYAELTANGYYFNEVTGQLSNGTLTLRALADMTHQSTVNVNILTHLKYARILRLVQQENKSYDTANSQAQRELLTAFGLQRFTDSDATSYSIASGTPEASALISISALILQGRTEAQVTEYLARMAQEFGQQGTFSTQTQAQIASDRSAISGKLATIQNNIIQRYKSLGITVSVQPLATFMDWDGDGIAGNESVDPNDPPQFSQTAIAAPKEGGTYTIHITSPVQLYLEQHDLSGDDIINCEPSRENVYYDLYDQPQSMGSVTRHIDGNTLTVQVGRTHSRKNDSTSFPIYDYTGNQVATITVAQDGDPTLPAPGLGEYGEMFIASAFKRTLPLADYMSSNANNYCMQSHYETNNYNGGYLQAPLYPTDGSIRDIWQYAYSALTQWLHIEQADRQQYAAFTHPINLFKAIILNQMITLWGDIPYPTQPPSPNYYDDQTYILPRTDKDQILALLTTQMQEALPHFEEKTYHHNTTIQDLFSPSKDLARLVLADLLMQQGQYSKAQPLLQEVINGGRYRLNYNADGDLIMAYITQNGNAPYPLYSLTDTYLRLAECQYQTGSEKEAFGTAYTVLNAYDARLNEDDNLLVFLDQIRRALIPTQIGRFAYLKRAGLCRERSGLLPFMELFPIPDYELMANPQLTQNPGYK